MTNTTQSTIRWQTSLDEALRQAHAGDKLVLLDFFSPTWGGCAALDTVTYPEASVVAAIRTHCVPLQVNTQEGSGAAVVERYRQVWTPDVRVLAADGFELYRWNGYLPPFEFVPQLLVALGQARLRLHDETGAAALYEEVLSRFPTSAVAPEAQYFLGVARYKASHEGADLAKGWHRLQTRYPESIWRTKQSFIER